MSSAEVAARHARQFPNVRLVTIDEGFGGWQGLTKAHFSGGGLLDQALARP